MKIPFALIKERQQESLSEKVKRSLGIIRDWYESWEGMVYIAFSGGKDSTALLHLVRSLYPEVPAVFTNTGLEYPEIISFVKSVENVEILHPAIPFHKIIQKYGYPVISKKQAEYINALQNATEKNAIWRRYILEGLNKKGEKIQSSMMLSKKWIYLSRAPFKISPKCCSFLKKQPSEAFEKNSGRSPIMGLMASNSRLRLQGLAMNGCNDWESKKKRSNPLMYWTESDVWDFLRSESIPYSKIYDMGYSNTGCMFCCFGVHLEGYPNRFQRMQKTHPKQWEYCIHKLGLKEVLDYIHVPYEERRIKSFFDLKSL